GGGQLGEAGGESGDDDGGGEPLGIPLAPGIEGDEVEGVVGGVYEAEQAEAVDPAGVLHPGRLLQDGVDLLPHRVGALERRPRGKLDVQVEIALILVGDEAGGQARPDEAREDRYHYEH